MSYIINIKFNSTKVLPGLNTHIFESKDFVRGFNNRSFVYNNGRCYGSGRDKGMGVFNYKNVLMVGDF